MSDEVKPTRLNKAATELNVGISTIVEFLHKKGIVIVENPNTKITPEIFALLVKEYQSDKAAKDEAMKIGLSFVKHEAITIEEKGVKSRAVEPESEPEDLIIKSSSVTFEQPAAQKDKKPPVRKPAEVEKAEEKAPVTAPVKETKVPEPEKKAVAEVVEKPAEKVEEEVKVKPEEPTEGEESKPESALKVLGKIDLDSINQKTRPAKKTKEEKKAEAQQKSEAKKGKKEEEVKPVVVEQEPEPVVSEPEPEEEEEIIEEKLPVIKTPVRDANFIPTRFEKLDGPKIFGKIDLPSEKKAEKKPVASSTDEKLQLKKKKRQTDQAGKIPGTGCNP